MGLASKVRTTLGVDLILWSRWWTSPGQSLWINRASPTRLDTCWLIFPAAKKQDGTLDNSMLVVVWCCLLGWQAMDRVKTSIDVGQGAGIAEFFFDLMLLDVLWPTILAVHGVCGWPSAVIGYVNHIFAGQRCDCCKSTLLPRWHNAFAGAREMPETVFGCFSTQHFTFWQMPWLSWWFFIRWRPSAWTLRPYEESLRSGAHIRRGEACTSIPDEW